MEKRKQMSLETNEHLVTQRMGQWLDATARNKRPFIGATLPHS